MCEKCDGCGMVYDVVACYDWYSTGGFDYESVVEHYCDCEAGDARRDEHIKDAERRKLEWELERDKAEAAGVEFIPF